MKEKYNDWFYKEDFEDCEGHPKPRLGFTTLQKEKFNQKT